MTYFVILGLIIFIVVSLVIVGEYLANLNNDVNDSDFGDGGLL